MAMGSSVFCFRTRRIGWFPSSHVELLPNPFAECEDAIPSQDESELSETDMKQHNLSRESMEARPRQVFQRPGMQSWATLRRAISYRGHPRARVVKAWPTPTTHEKFAQGQSHFELQQGDIVVLTERPHPIGDLTVEDVDMLVKAIDSDQTGTIEKKELRHLFRHFSTNAST